MQSREDIKLARRAKHKFLGIRYYKLFIHHKNYILNKDNYEEFLLYHLMRGIKKEL